MNFELSEEQLAVQQAARDFAQNELKSGVIKRDSNSEYPYKAVKRKADKKFGKKVSLYKNIFISQAVKKYKPRKKK